MTKENGKQSTLASALKKHKRKVKRSKKSVAKIKQQLKNTFKKAGKSKLKKKLRVNSNKRSLFVAIVKALNKTKSTGICQEVSVTCSEPYCTDGALLALYEFENNADDTSGNNKDAINNGAFFSEGIDGQGITFSGNGSFVDVSKVKVVDIRTFAAWLKFESFDVSDARIISRAVGTGTDDHDFMVSTISSNGSRVPRVRWRIGEEVHTVIPATGSLPDSEWVHIAVTYNGEAIKLYVDGEEVESYPITGEPSVKFVSDTYLGLNPDGERSLDAVMDEVVLSGKAYSPVQILALADQDEVNQCSDLIDNDGDGATDEGDFSCKTGANTESALRSQCQDGRDNDVDGLVDLADPSCLDAQDNNESS